MRTLMVMLPPELSLKVKPRRSERWSVSVKRIAQRTKLVWDSSTTKKPTFASNVNPTVKSAECSKATVKPAVGVCTKLPMLPKLKLKMKMETLSKLLPRSVRNVTPLVRDAPVQPPTNVKVALKDSNSETTPVSPEADVKLVRSNSTLLILSASKMTEPDAKSAKPVTTKTAIDARTTSPVAATSARKVTLELLLVTASSAPKAASSARMLLPA